VGGCTNCKSKTGCDDRKGDMLAAVDDVLARIYPSRTWGEPDDEALVLGGACDDGPALAEELAVALDAAAFFVPGEPDALCDYVHVLCVGRTPCILQVRDLGVPVPDEWGDGPVIERYLRISLSSVARIAAVQEVALEARRHRAPDGARGGDDWIFVERTRAGVYDAPLLRRMQRLVAILPAYDLLHVDFGEISAPPPGYHAGAWPARYGGGEPAIANYLFFPEPTTMARTCSTTR
jgi:hypothetical protein